MMYSKLVKILFHENFSLKRLLGINTRQQKKKAILIGILILYGLGAFIFSFGLLFMDLGDLL